MILIARVLVINHIKIINSVQKFLTWMRDMFCRQKCRKKTPVQILADL